MTHKEKLLALFAEFGLRPGAERPYMPVCENDYCISGDGRAVVLGEGRNGYNGFYCEFRFDESGNFVEHRCLE